MQRTRPVPARRREAAPELERGDRPQHAQPRECAAPSGVVGQQAADEPAGHAARRVARDDQAHRLAQRARIHLLGQPCRGHRRQPGQAQAQQGAQRDQRAVARRDRAQQAEQRAQHDGGEHHRLGAVALRQEAGGDQAQRHRTGGGRQHAAGLRGVERERAAEQRQQRLGPVEHAEGGEAAHEQRPTRGAMGGAAGGDRRRQRVALRARHDGGGQSQAGRGSGHGAIVGSRA